MANSIRSFVSEHTNTKCQNTNNLWRIDIRCIVACLAHSLCLVRKKKTGDSLYFDRWGHGHSVRHRIEFDLAQFVVVSVEGYLNSSKLTCKWMVCPQPFISERCSCPPHRHRSIQILRCILPEVTAIRQCAWVAHTHFLFSFQPTNRHFIDRLGFSPHARPAVSWQQIQFRFFFFHFPTTVAAATCALHSKQMHSLFETNRLCSEKLYETLWSGLGSREDSSRNRNKMQ